MAVRHRTNWRRETHRWLSRHTNKWTKLGTVGEHHRTDQSRTAMVSTMVSQLRVKAGQQSGTLLSTPRTASSGHWKLARGFTFLFTISFTEQCDRILIWIKQWNGFSSLPYILVVVGESWLFMVVDGRLMVGFGLFDWGCQGVEKFFGCIFCRYQKLKTNNNKKNQNILLWNKQSQGQPIRNEPTFQIYRNAAFNTLKQIIHFSFSSKGMNSIHFPEK